MNTKIKAVLWFEQDNPIDILGFNVVSVWSVGTIQFPFSLPDKSAILSIFRTISQTGSVTIVFDGKEMNLFHRLFNSRKTIFKVFLFAEENVESDDSDFGFSSILMRRVNEFARVGLTNASASGFNVRNTHNTVHKSTIEIVFRGTV